MSIFALDKGHLDEKAIIPRIFNHDFLKKADYICYAKECYHISSAYIVPAKSGISGHIGIEVELPLRAGQKIDETCTAIASDERVSFAIELSEQ